MVQFHATILQQNFHEQSHFNPLSANPICRVIWRAEICE